MGASIGIAVAGPADDADALTHHADRAMYDAKSQVRNRSSLDAAVAAPSTVVVQETVRMLGSARLDHVVIAVRDWDRSITFYRDVLGAEVIDHPDGRVAFRFGTQQLNVHGPGLDLGSLVAKPPVAPGGSDLCFVWPGSQDTLTEHLAVHGVEVEQGPVTRHGGAGVGRSTYFRDPDGSLLEFIVYSA